MTEELTEDETLKQWAERAGLGCTSSSGGMEYFQALSAQNESTAIKRLRRFAALVRMDEREACAKACEELIDTEWPGDDISAQAQACADAIRSRTTEEVKRCL